MTIIRKRVLSNIERLEEKNQELTTMIKSLEKKPVNGVLEQKDKDKKLECLIKEKNNLEHILVREREIEPFKNEINKALKKMCEVVMPGCQDDFKFVEASNVYADVIIELKKIKDLKELTKWCTIISDRNVMNEINRLHLAKEKPEVNPIALLIRDAKVGGAELFAEVYGINLSAEIAKTKTR